MSTEPLYSITAIFTSLKLAVISVVTVIAISAEWDDVMKAAVVGAAAALTMAIGDIVGAILTHDRVTPYTAPSEAKGE